MRSLTKDQEFNRAMDEAVKKFLMGRDAMRIKQIAKEMGEDPFDVRRSLIRLVDRGEVFKVYQRTPAPGDWAYEKAHGGYSPTGGDAA